VIRTIGSELGDRLLRQAGAAMAKTQARRPLPVDLLERDDAYLTVFDAPGVEGADVQTRFEDGTIHVRLDRYREPREGFEMRFPGRALTLEGSVDLPEQAHLDPEKATATLHKNGTLHVRLPKVRPE
jgi:HSP20 family protein